MIKCTLAANLTVGTVAIVVLAACASEPASKPEAATSAPQTTLPIAPPARTAPAPSQGVSGNPFGASGGAAVDKRSVYYDFDSFALKSEFKPVVEAHATYLKQHPGSRVTVEGNCDERGSREYNLALGQRRAASVKKMLELAGVPDARVEAVSLGKEKPRALGHDERAWSENRRSDFDYSR